MKGAYTKGLWGEKPPTANSSAMHSVQRGAEALVILAWFALFTHLVTSTPASAWKTSAAFALLAGGVLVTISPWAGRAPSRTRLMVIMAGLMTGFAVFVLFCRVGLVDWPMARATGLGEYAALAYSHLVFALTVTAAIVWSGWAATRLTQNGNDWNWHQGLAWGHWRTPRLGVVSFLGLSLLAGLAWGYSLWYAATHPLPHALGTHPAVWPLCGLVLAKAFLTGTLEEVSYRGLIQPSAIARFGPVCGILLQSGLYAVFHLHLGPAILGPSTFLAGLVALGILFGAIAQRTKGIGWSCTVHIALDVVVEWGNLS